MNATLCCVLLVSCLDRHQRCEAIADNWVYVRECCEVYDRDMAAIHDGWRDP